MSFDSVFCPKVSIVIPVYNGANYVREAIDSALAQTYSNTEVIVVNDGSCDDGATRDAALSYGDRIRYFEKENGGVSSALNHGIRHMTGEYFSWLSHDDKYEPDKVLHSVQYLSSFAKRERLIVFCGSSYINEKSERIKDVEDTFEKGTVYPGQDVLRYILKRKMLNACCMLIPKTAFDECGYFNEDLRYNQDMLMLYQIFGGGYGLVADTEQRDVMYRLHAMQTSKTRRDLFVRDSYELAKIIAPVFARQDGDGGTLLLFAKKNAKHDCKNAVDECVRVGRASKVLAGGDVIRIRIWSLGGKIRNLLKAIYHRLRFK